MIKVIEDQNLKHSIATNKNVYFDRYENNREDAVKAAQRLENELKAERVTAVVVHDKNTARYNVYYIYKNSLY